MRTDSTGRTNSSTRRAWILGMAIGFLVASSGGQAQARAAGPLDGVRRVVFVGDSITYSGQFIEEIETYLRLKNPDMRTEFLDLGLPSETVSGLSEPGHAGGAFPRPDLHERFVRVLEQLKPDLVVACYGMNDGIYYPFGEDRFRKYQDGIRLLRARSAAAGAKVLHLTPPVFDPVPIQSHTLPAGLAEYRQPYAGYDEVLARYSDWLISERANGWDVVDIHGPMRALLDARRGKDPAFRLAGDGVHAGPEGHWLMARAVLKHWNAIDPKDLDATSAEAVFQAMPRGLEVLKLVERRQRLMKNAWLSAVGHKRPGMAKGAPIADAETQGRAIDKEIRKITTR